MTPSLHGCWINNPTNCSDCEMHVESGQGQMIILEGTNDIMNLPFLPDISYYGIHIQEYNWLPSEDDGCV